MNNQQNKLPERGAAFVLENGKTLLIYKRDGRNDINVGIVNAYIQTKYCSHLQSSVLLNMQEKLNLTEIKPIYKCIGTDKK